MNQFFIIMFIFTGFFLQGCNGLLPAKPVEEVNVVPAQSRSENSVIDISPSAGYYRQRVAPGSFAFFLQNCKLKQDKTVYLYNGARKPNQSAQYAVLDINVGNKDLQHAPMR